MTQDTFQTRIFPKKILNLILKSHYQSEYTKVKYFTKRPDRDLGIPLKEALKFLVFPKNSFINFFCLF